MATRKRGEMQRVTGLERAIAEDRAGQEILAAAERATTAKRAKEAVAAKAEKPKGRSRFRVKWQESLRHETTVDAESEDDAREAVMAGNFDARDDLVVDDSFEGITSVKKVDDDDDDDEA